MAEFCVNYIRPEEKEAESVYCIALFQVFVTLSFLVQN